LHAPEDALVDRRPEYRKEGEMRTIRPLPTLAFVSLVALPACSGDSNTGPPPPPPPAPPPALGSVRVAVTTTGDDFDLSAYLVSIGDDVQLIEWNDVATFNDLSAGDHFVDLEDVAENCSVAGSATKQTTVAAGATADVAFDISCAALPPAEVDVTGTWDGEWEGTDNVGGGSGSGSIRFELEQDGDEVSGMEILDDATYSVVGRVSGNTVSLFVAGWTRPSTGYQHRRISAGEVDGSVLAGTTEEQRGEFTGTFRVTRQ
jgi:hypothetical protein